MKKILLLCLYFIMLATTPLSAADNQIGINEQSLGKLPVLFNGRLQPFEALARQMLISFREKSSLSRTTNDKSIPVSASMWLWDVLTHNPIAMDDVIFLIHDIDIKHEYQLDDSKKVFSYRDLEPHILTIQANVVALANKENLTVYERNLQQLAGKLSLYISLLHSFIPYQDYLFYDYVTAYHKRVKRGLDLFNEYNATGVLKEKRDQLHLLEFNQDFKRHRQFSEISELYLYPNHQDPENLALWTNTGSELLKNLDYNYETNPVLLDYAKLSLYSQQQDTKQFNKTLDSLHTYFANSLSSYQTVLTLEYYFTMFNPFYISMILYVFVFCSIFLFYLLDKAWLYSVSKYTCLAAFSLHSVSLIARMIILNRPPVINLYSSAVFVGWVAIGLCLLQERLFRNKLGYFMSSILGFITLIVAHHLALQTDTMAQMQAVLDSNFWLSTHVITITLGYGGTFLAGMIATCYVGLNSFKRSSKQLNSQLYKMVYAIICFSLFFSFIGTVLGGIWADQSWGRFWGWDPKENGALLIVIFNAIILHARLAGVAGIRGVMLLAVLGNIVTAFSWFGVNMLGVGLHSYGFMDAAFQWLMFYIVTQLIIVAIGFNLIKPKT
tara:strand:- start:2627 stop:4456 length:1830 start_codon:yes stop_codon:yes gene_type:complete